MTQAPSMLILALDTTTRGGSVAVTNDDQLLALVPGDDTRTHAERLPGEIAAALERAGVSRSAVDVLAVATGPGAFTGLRIGLATIQGLAMALGRPVAGISALDALAWQLRAEVADFIVPWMDAQRGEVFAALYPTLPADPLRQGAQPFTSEPATLLDQWREQLDGRSAIFTGDAVTRDQPLLTRWSSRLPEPLAPAIAALARQAALAGRTGLPHVLEPIYVRRPDPEIERERRKRL